QRRVNLTFEELDWLIVAAAVNLANYPLQIRYHTGNKLVLHDNNQAWEPLEYGSLHADKEP
ncbi:hypothetical protein, partial [Klebsiella pneumoniae]|uniref:hypothetical protein n=1 Tax=Klebsiella pneumoniae TaxID=573 RepID=UPI00272F135A